MSYGYQHAPLGALADAQEQRRRNPPIRERAHRLALSEGHAPRCAERIVWGDGACECGLMSTVALVEAGDGG